MLLKPNNKSKFENIFLITAVDEIFPIISKMLNHDSKKKIQRFCSTTAEFGGSLVGTFLVLIVIYFGINNHSLSDFRVSTGIKCLAKRFFSKS